MISDPDTTDPSQKPYLNPFTVVIDTNETLPYHFLNLHTDADRDYRPLIVPTVRKQLWRMGVKFYEIKGQQVKHGLADYSIDGLEDEIQVERKTIGDLYATLGGRSEEFEAEFCRLSECKFAALVIEGGWDQICQPQPESKMNPKTISRRLLKWQIRYPVKIITCVDRRHAEVVTFRLLAMYWEEREQVRKAEAKAVKQLVKDLV